MRVHIPDVVVTLTKEQLTAQVLLLELDRTLPSGTTVQLLLPSGVVLDQPIITNPAVPLPPLDVAAIARPAVVPAPGELSRRSALLLGERVREARARFKGTAKKFAAKVGVSEALLHQLSRAEYDRCNNEVVSIVQRLDIDVSDLPEFGELPPMSKPVRAISRKTPLPLTTKGRKELATRVQTTIGERTRQAFAKAGGVNVSSVYRLLRGDVQLLGPRLIVALEKWGVQYQDLIKEVQEEKKESAPSAIPIRQASQHATPQKGRKSRPDKRRVVALTTRKRAKLWKAILAAHERQGCTLYQFTQQYLRGSTMVYTYRPGCSTPAHSLTQGMLNALQTAGVDLAGIVD